MNRRTLLTVPLLCLGLLLADGPVPVGDTASLAVRQQLGRKLFFDTKLSQPAGQACASCHAPRTGFRAATLEAQTRGPLLSPLEMANHDVKRLVEKVRAAAPQTPAELIYLNS